MIIFIYGDYVFLSRKRLDILKNEFIEKYGDINCLTIDVSSVPDSVDITQHLKATPFLADKHMVVLDSFLSSAKKKVMDSVLSMLDDIGDDLILVFYEQGDDFDKRMSIYKYLNKNAKTEKFDSPKGAKLKDYILDKLKDSDLTISSDAMNMLLLIWDSKSKDKDEDSLKNINSLNNELDKIILYVDSEGRKEVNSQDISINVSIHKGSKVFDLIDFIGKKNIKKAINETENLLQDGENVFYILSMIVYQFRLLLKIKSMTYQEATKEEIQSSIKIHPFVLYKAMDQVKNYTFEELKDIYRRILDLEYKMKSTDLDPIVALSSFIVEIST